VSTKKADLFELCRSGDLPRFASEIISQLSVEYDSEDVATLVSLQFNYHPGCKFLLKGFIGGTYPGQDGHSYSVCLTPPIPLTDRLCWLVGEVKLHKKNSDYEVELTTINPFGTGKFNDENFQVLCDAVAAEIKSINPSAKVTFSNKETILSVNKPEKFSSGPLVVEIITNLIKGTKSTEELASTLKANETRSQHVSLVKKSLKEVDSRRVRFLSRHLDIDQVNLPKKTLLETACQHGHGAIVGFLVDDMLVNVSFSLSGYDPIFSALRGAKVYPSKGPNLLCYLLQGSTDPSLSRPDRKGAYLHNVVDLEGRSVLHVAVGHGVDGSVETLVKWGIRHPGTVDLFTKNKKNRTALHEAICLSRYSRLHGVIRVLLRYGLGQPKATLETLKEDKDVKQQALAVVISYLEEQVQRVQKISLRPAQKLQRTGSFVDLTFLRGRSGSYLGGLVNNMMSPRVSYEWKSKIAQYCAENKIANLPTKGSELNALDEEGFAPIHVACVCGKPELLEHLINIKVEAFKVVDLNLVTRGVVKRKIEGKDETPELINTKLTPLHLAVLCQRRFPEFVTKLLAQGVQVTQDSNQCTALHYAVGRDSKFVELILAHLDKTNSLDVANLPDKEGITAMKKALLTADKAMIMPFINIGIWPSEIDIMFESEINQRENRVEVKQTLVEILEFIKARYPQPTVATQQSVVSLKSPR
jgi:ankyrin repeat protein